MLSAFNVMGIRKRFMWASAFGVTSTVIIALAMMMFAEEKAMDAGSAAVPSPELPMGENKIISNVTITYEIR